MQVQQSARSSLDLNLQRQQDFISNFKPSQDRLKQLRSQFAMLDLTNDSRLTIDEIQTALSQKGRVMDRDILLAIFNDLDADNNGYVDQDEFIEYYSRAEGILENNIRQEQQYLEDCRKKVEGFKTDLRQIGAKGDNQQSQASLTIRVYSAHNLQSKFQVNNPAFKTSISCFSQQYQTKTAYGNNPQWNEEFTFKISQNVENATVVILDASTTQDEIVGMLTIPLKNIQDQLNHDDPDLRLWDPSGNDLTNQRIHLAVQYVRNRESYIREMIHEYEVAIDTTQRTIQDTQSKLEKLQQPFNLYKESPEKPSFHSMKTGVSYAKESLSPKEVESETGQTGLFAIFLLNVLIMFNRPDFFTQVVVFMGIFYTFQNQLNAKNIQNILLALIVSIIIDIVWLYLVPDQWLEGSVNILTYALTYIGIIAKAITAVIYYKKQAEFTQ